MTSKLTRLTDDELTETLRQATSGYPLPASVEGNLRHAFAELQERRKNEKDSEPVAWTSETALADVSCEETSMIGQEGVVGNIPLYRHAQPAPVAKREPIAWLNDAYLARGVVDGEAGSEDAGPGYIPVYREASPAQPAPVVPEEKPMPNPLSMYAVDAVAAIAEAKGWNACRAAMLQHQPQNAQQNIPENIPGGLVEAVNNLLNNDGSRGCYDAMECGTAREKIELWLAQRQRWEEQRKANLSAGNSPVIPDGYRLQPISEYEAMCATVNSDEWPQRWIPVSERMPDETQPVIVVSEGGVVQRTVYQFCEGVWSDWYDMYDDVNVEAFTHWMPLPAAPQEVKGE